MTDQELNDAVAMALFGVRRNAMRPSTNIADAFLVVDEMERRGYCWDGGKNVDGIFGIDFCKVHPNDDIAITDAGVWRGSAEDDNRCRAICLAALGAVREESSFYATEGAE